MEISLILTPRFSYHIQNVSRFVLPSIKIMLFENVRTNGLRRRQEGRKLKSRNLFITTSLFLPYFFTFRNTFQAKKQRKVF